MDEITQQLRNGEAGAKQLHELEWAIERIFGESGEEPASAAEEEHSIDDSTEGEESEGE